MACSSMSIKQPPWPRTCKYEACTTLNENLTEGNIERTSDENKMACVGGRNVLYMSDRGTVNL